MRPRRPCRTPEGRIERLHAFNALGLHAEAAGDPDPVHGRLVQAEQIAPDVMKMNKQSINRGYELRGFQASIDYGAEMFALIHLLDSDEKREFFDLAAREGLKAAFKWRDERFSSPNGQ